ncbi:hypothetical protein GPL21_33175 [Bradyrhizobium pachyrhizi]|uniref:Pectate lyase superfamily protein domain-containing protein n=1 Tax=Bradyrhizobium pachyrhizi TaxID=280333 RepID=A0A844T336_9BRAD|nr:hypothetical protein [Bradyrhizobium pachyrhizi]MVT69942.1 hypothetical protein [Bradyrhizobium pachyrhizi]
MSYPTKYTRQYDFSSYQNTNPNRPLPATKVNADLNAVAQSTSEIVDFLKTSLRADGMLANGSVGFDQLSAVLAASLGDASALQEVLDQIAPDVAAAEAAATNAAASATDASNSSISASSSATSAGNSATAASGSASAAAISETNAAASATAAAASATALGNAIVGPGASADGELVLYNGVTGKSAKRLALGASQFALGVSGGSPIASLAPMVDAASAYSVDKTGATDCSSALQAAITALAAAGAIIYLAGTFNVGSAQITVPDNASVVCGRGTIIRRTAEPTYSSYSSSAGAMISLGNNVHWSGGKLDNNVVVAQSATSFTIAVTSSKVFNVGSGLSFTAGNFIRGYSRSNPANHFEGTVNSYSGTSLDVNVTFAVPGSPTATDWNFNFGAIWHSPMVMQNVSGCLVEGVWTTGNWYVGIICSAWNPSTGGSAVTTRITIKDCYAQSIQNRGFYLYGTCSDILFENCYVYGGNGTTDYCFNFNPANATGSANVQIRVKLIGCTAAFGGGHGFGIGDNCSYFTLGNCTANGTPTGFLIQQGNNGVASYNRLSNCIAHNCSNVGFLWAGALYGGASGCSAILCGYGFECTSQGGHAAQYISMTECEAVSSTFSGFYVTGSSIDISLQDIKALSNGTFGVAVDAGVTNTIVTGRVANNSSGTIFNSGTGTVSTNLVTV